MYPGLVLTVFAGFTLLAGVDVMTGRKWVASGAGLALICVSN